MISHGAPDGFGILKSMMTWQFGVDIFFIISGFIMLYVSSGRATGPKAAATFLKKRFIRIVPLYWIYTALVIVPMIVAPGAMKRTGFSAEYILSSLFFIPYPRPGLGDLAPVLALGWTLNYEMLFYVIFALLMVIRVRRMAFWLCLILAAIFAAGLFVQPGLPQLWYWTRSCILEFAFGALIAVAFIRGVTLPKWAGLLAIAAGIAIWQVVAFYYPVAEGASNYRGYTWGVAAALIVAGLTLVPAFSAALEWGGPNGWPQRIGDASYSLYLNHMFVVRICTILFGILLANGLTSILYMLITLTACTVAALLSYRWLEKPIVALGRGERPFRRNPRGLAPPLSRNL